jgi:hypothetical protein
LSAIAEKIDAIVREGLVEPLKQAGYTKRARTFHLKGDSIVRVVNVQGCKWNIGDTGQFTINLGIYLPHIVKCLRERELPPGKLPAEWDCTVRMRIGELMPAGQDYWWKIDISSDLSEIATEVKEAWINYGRPWLHQDWGNLRVARDLLASGGPIEAAVAASLLLNEPDAAKRIALNVINEYRQNNQSKQAEWLEWRVKVLGVSLD